MGSRSLGGQIVNPPVGLGVGQSRTGVVAHSVLPAIAPGHRQYLCVTD